MQIQVKSTKILKKGTNDYGEWKLVQVITTDDIKYTTLADDAATISPGSTINITNMDKDTQGRESFKKYEFVGEQSEAPRPAPKATIPESDARQTSIETQNAFTNIMNSFNAGKLGREDPIVQACFNYASDRLAKWYSQGTVEKNKPHPEEAKFEALWPEQAKQTDEEAEAQVEELAPKVKEKIETSLEDLDFDAGVLLADLAEVKWKDTTVKSYCKTMYKTDKDGVLLDSNLDVVDFINSLREEDRLAFFEEIGQQKKRRQ